MNPLSPMVSPSFSSSLENDNSKSKSKKHHIHQEQQPSPRGVAGIAIDAFHKHGQDSYLQDRLEVVQERIGILLKRQEQQQKNQLLDDPTIRASILTWMSSVVDILNFDSSLVARATALMNAYLAATTDTTTTSQDVTLVAASCLHLTIKLHEVSIVPLTDYVKYCHGNYTLKQFERMEVAIMSTLNFGLHPVVAEDYVEQFLQVVQIIIVLDEQDDDDEEEDSCCLVADVRQFAQHFCRKLLVSGKETMQTPPSVVALASFLAAVHFVLRQQRHHGTTTTPYQRAWLCRILQESTGIDRDSVPLKQVYAWIWQSQQQQQQQQ